MEPEQEIDVIQDVIRNDPKYSVLPEAISQVIKWYLLYHLISGPICFPGDQTVWAVCYAIPVQITNHQRTFENIQST